MKLPAFSVRRPVFTSMVTLIVVIIGIFSMARLKIDLLPDIELPTLTIRTEYEGASPEVMERLVTQIIEEIVGVVPGVVEMSSESSEGNSSIRVSFAWGSDINTAALDVQAMLEKEINELPDDVGRPRISKFDLASYPVVIIGIASELDPVEMTELVENQLRYRFSRLPGVAQVDLLGEYTREIRVELDPDRIKALGLPLDRILQAVRNANIDLPAGKLYDGKYELTLRAPAEFSSLEQIRETVILQRNGGAVTLGQIARVNDTYEKLRRITRVNGGRGLRVAIRKQADANTVEVARSVLAEIERINHNFPQISAVPVINQGNFIERSINNVARSVLYGGSLSVLVLLFFLRSVRSTLVISLAIPISVIATFALIYFGGFTLNLMTLGGLALGVGMMVDSSVVVLENIFRRHVESGETIRTAAVAGAQEVGPAIVASTITTLVIFLPLIFVRGVAGKLFQELSYVIMFSLTCSLLVALSLLPMLTARLLGGRGRERDGAAVQRGAGVAGAEIGTAGKVASKRKGNKLGVTQFGGGLFRWAESVFNGIERRYQQHLGLALRYPWLTILLAAVLLGSALLLAPQIGTEFMPPSDEGEVRITGEMEIGTRLDLLDRQARQLEQLVYPAVPEMISAVTRVGGSGWRPSDATKAEIRLALAPAAERERSNSQIAAELRTALDGKIAGMTIRTRAPQGQFLLERILGSDQGITVEIRGYDLATLNRLANQASAAIRDVPGITDIETSQDGGIPQQEIRIDRDKTADLGLSLLDVGQLLATAVAGSKAGEYRVNGNSYRIFVQLADVENRSLDDILGLTITTASGEQVSLRNLVSESSSEGPMIISRKDQQRLATLSANIAGRDLGSVAREVQERLDSIPRQVGYELQVAGNFEEQQKAFRDLIVSLVLALLLVYMVLACQYESLRDPLIVMVSVPVAAVGVIVVLFLTGTTLNLQSFIGCIMLSGIVVNNAILLVDQAGQLVSGGMIPQEAIAEAGRRRLRPILMTTMTTVLALMPLALGIGEGADAQAPLARAVVGGLAGSGLITLLLIPAVYLLFYRNSPRIRPSDPE